MEHFDFDNGWRLESKISWFWHEISDQNPEDLCHDRSSAEVLSGLLNALNLKGYKIPGVSRFVYIDGNCAVGIYCFWYQNNKWEQTSGYPFVLGNDYQWLPTRWNQQLCGYTFYVVLRETFPNLDSFTNSVRKENNGYGENKSKFDKNISTVMMQRLCIQVPGACDHSHRTPRQVCSWE